MENDPFLDGLPITNGDFQENESPGTIKRLKSPEPSEALRIGRQCQDPGDQLAQGRDVFQDVRQVRDARLAPGGSNKI